VKTKVMNLWDFMFWWIWTWCEAL